MSHSILIIEDAGELRTCLRTELERAGYSVREASTGKEGMCAYHQTPTDVVMTDIFMPEGDGLEVIMTLRRECSRQRGSAKTISFRLRDTSVRMPSCTNRSTSKPYSEPFHACSRARALTLNGKPD